MPRQLEEGSPDHGYWPRITVVTPSFNQAPFLEQTILSVLGQSYPNLEYIVMDGGSADGSIDILANYTHRVTYWESTPDRGQAHAINKGFTRATGDILCWLNSDDFYLPNVLRRVARLFKVGSPELVYGACILFDADRHWARLETADSPFDRERYRSVSFLHQPSTFWSRALWEMAGPLDETMHYGFDWEWFNRAADCGEFSGVPFPISAYRFHLRQKTGGGDSKARRNELREVVSRYADRKSVDLFAAVDERILPGLLELRRLNRIRGMWRIQSTIERVWRRTRYADVYLRYGYAAVERALGMLDV